MIIYNKDTIGAPNIAESRRSSIALIKMKIGQNCMPSSPFHRFWKSILKFKDSMMEIMANRNFFLLLVSYGFINGTFYAFIILAGPLIRPNLPSSDDIDKKVGIIAMLVFIFGFVGATIGGIFIDKFKRFKALSLVWYGFSLLSLSAFVYVGTFGIFWVNTVVASLIGFFMIGIVPICFNFGGELVYPESEATGSALLTCSADLIGVIVIETSKAIFKALDKNENGFAATGASIFLIGCVLIGLLILCFVKEVLTRQEAGAIKDFAALVAKTFQLPDTSFQNRESSSASSPDSAIVAHNIEEIDDTKKSRT